MVHSPTYFLCYVWEGKLLQRAKKKKSGKSGTIIKSVLQKLLRMRRLGFTLKKLYYLNPSPDRMCTIGILGRQLVLTSTMASSSKHPSSSCFLVSAASHTHTHTHTPISPYTWNSSLQFFSFGSLSHHWGGTVQLLTHDKWLRERTEKSYTAVQKHQGFLPQADAARCQTINDLWLMLSRRCVCVCVCVWGFAGLYLKNIIRTSWISWLPCEPINPQSDPERRRIFHFKGLMQTLPPFSLSADFIRSLIITLKYAVGM